MIAVYIFILLTSLYLFTENNFSFSLRIHGIYVYIAYIYITDREY